MILGEKKRNSVKSIINTTEIEQSKKVVLLGITIDNLLTFNERIDNLCRTANYKLHALQKIRKYYLQRKLNFYATHLEIVNLIMLYWYVGFAEKKTYLKIQKIRYKTLKVVYNSTKNYYELLRDNNEVSIHQSHLHNLNSDFMCLFFVFKNITYKIRKSPLITCCKIDFLRHKFSVTQSMPTLEQLAPIF